jgi:signal peptidase II
MGGRGEGCQAGGEGATTAAMRLMQYGVARQWGLMVAAVVLLLDFISKELVLGLAAQGGLPLWWVPGQLGFQLGWNRGMSFSLLHDWVHAPWLLGALAVGLSAWFVHWLGEKRVGEAGWGWHQAGLGLIIGGALGNLLDRLQHGAVVDFVVLNPWGLFPYTFNLADTAITFGVLGMVVETMLSLRTIKHAGKQQG